MKLNLVELASEMAETMLNNVTLQSGKTYTSLYVEDENGNTSYTEEAQDLFDDYYDYIYELLTKKGFEHYG